MTYIYLLLLTLLAICFALIFFRTLLRKRYPASVVCWFCGEKTKVLYKYRNCWDCPSCEQYNGFNKDGGYNKPIPAHYDERLNQPIKCEKDEFLGGHDVLCEKCSQNQLLKVKQLANFEPYDEKNYDYEVEAYARHLEKVYRLCLPCEIKVQQELEIQNEAISKRLSYLDQFKSFINNSLQEENILHSSYTDRRVNKQIVISYVLHGLSLLCSVLIFSKEIRLDGDRPWQRYLLCMHPLLLWIDKNVEMLVFLQIVTNLMAKLLLGLNRLHIVDAVSCPVWLLVLLSHMGYLPFLQTGSVYNTCCLVLNCVTCGLCLGIRRKRHNKPNIRMTRMSLDASNTSISDSVSSVSPFSSVSQTGSRSCVNEHVAPSSSFSTSGKYDDVPQPDSTEDKTDEELTQLNDTADEKDNCHSNIEDTTSELNAFSLGEPCSKRPSSESGIFSSVSQSTSNLFNQSVTNNLRARKFGQGRPLLSPPTFNHSSTPERHRLSPLPKFGLFSTSSSQVQSPSFINRPSSSLHQSAFLPTPLPSTQRHSFTPEQPSSPVVTSFGAPPFSNVPLQSDRLSQCSSTTYRSTKCSYVRPYVNKSKNREQKSKKHADITELSDDEDNLSDITSISRQCPVDSTSETDVKRKPDIEPVPWWRHPGFIGFILGGSVVANVVLVSQITLSNKSS